MNGLSKDQLYEELARVGHALGNGHRLEIIDLLCQGERNVEELAAEARLSLANASQHLQILHRAHLVQRRREGVQVRYALADPGVARLWMGLRDAAAERIPEVARVADGALGPLGESDLIEQAEVERRLATNQVFLLDVRPRLEYAAGHIAGSISLPLEELESRLSELPREREIVAYCRGPFCTFANAALQCLRAAGFRARRMEAGYPEWNLSGRPVQVGAA
ncbi:MAG: ArsR/SmtB family transcription factor [Candidatus Dormibacteria bacterium]